MIKLYELSINGHRYSGTAEDIIEEFRMVMATMDIGSLRVYSIEQIGVRFKGN